MARRAPAFICQSCGASYTRWQGKCDACGAWNSLAEETTSAPPMPVPGARPGGRLKGRIVPLEGPTGSEAPAPRAVSGIGELHRVTGGGCVEGSVILIGGDPGIGKSTLLIQA